MKISCTTLRFITFIAFHNSFLAFAEVIYVNTNGNDSAGCGGVKHACRTLRYAVGISTPNANIFINGSLSSEMSEGPIDIKHNLTLLPYVSTYVSACSCGNNSGLFRVINNDAEKVVALTLNRFNVTECPSKRLIYLRNARLDLISSVFWNDGTIVKHEQISNISCRINYLNIRNSTFKSNIIDHPYEGAFALYGCDSSVLTVTNSAFHSSPFSVDSLSQDVSFTNVNFEAVKGVQHIFRSSISRETSSIKFLSCTFSAGGKIAINPILILFGGKGPCNKSTVSFMNSFFSIKHSETSGGAIYVGPRLSDQKHTNLTVVVRNCTFTGNKAEVDGGGMYVKGVMSMTIDKSKFIGNSARNGGAVYSEEIDEARIINTDFENNSAEEESPIYPSRGGALYHKHSNISIVGCLFNNNLAVYEGNSIYSLDCHHTALDHATFQRSLSNQNSPPENSDVVLKTRPRNHINMTNIMMEISQPDDCNPKVMIMTGEGRIKIKNVTCKCPNSYDLKLSTVELSPSEFLYSFFSYWCKRKPGQITYC